MQVKAAVLEQPSGRFALETLELGEVRPNEVLVKIVACGICQTDSHVREQHIPVPLPAVLGHEGAGIIESVGSGVSGLSVGDHVVLSYGSCGRCRPCRLGVPPYCELLFPLNFGGSRLDGSQTLCRSEGTGDRAIVHTHLFGQSSFATYAIADERNVVKVRPDAPLEVIAPLGCGFQTGFGAVVNSLRVETGSSIAVAGTGGVGLAAIMAAKISGAQTIIGIDVKTDRLQLALDLGATHIINAATEDVGSAIAKVTAGGVNYALEVTGRPEMGALMVDALAPLGTAGLIGLASLDAQLSISLLKLMQGRSVRGITQGDAVPQLLIPQMVEHYMAGRFPIDRLTKSYEFADINTAFDDAGRGVVVKPVLSISRT